MHIIKPTLTLLMFFAVRADAAVTTLNDPVPKAGMTLKDFIFILIDIMQMIAVPMLVMAVIYAGYLMVTAAGNEVQITKAKMWFLWITVGATVVLGAKVIANIVYNTAGLF